MSTNCTTIIVDAAKANNPLCFYRHWDGYNQYHDLVAVIKFLIKTGETVTPESIIQRLNGATDYSTQQISLEDYSTTGLVNYSVAVTIQQVGQSTLIQVVQTRESPEFESFVVTKEPEHWKLQLDPDFASNLGKKLHK